MARQRSAVAVGTQAGLRGLQLEGRTSPAGSGAGRGLGRRLACALKLTGFLSPLSPAAHKKGTAGLAREEASHPLARHTGPACPQPASRSGPLLVPGAGQGAMLAVTQLCVWGPGRAKAAQTPRGALGAPAPLPLASSSAFLHFP